MSDVYSTPKHSTPSAIPSPYPDLAALAVSLQETAQALLTFSATNADEDTSPSPAKPVRDRDGETRSFYFPPASVNMERELLRKYRDDHLAKYFYALHHITPSVRPTTLRNTSSRVVLRTTNLFLS